MLTEERVRTALQAPPDRLWRLPLERALSRIDVHALRAAGTAFVVSRLLLLAVGYLSVALRIGIAGYPAVGWRVPWKAWYQWDAHWFVRIAEHGYQWQNAHQFSSVAFFPVFPMMIALLHGVAPVPFPLAGMLVANGSFAIALYALHRLARREWGEVVATRTVLYLSLFPVSLFFFAGYSEAPYLLWSVLCLAALRRRRWAWAALWGFLATGTRSMGLALLAPFAIELWQAYGTRRANRCWVWMIAVPGGIACYALYLGARFGNPLLFDRAQRAWHRTTTWPWRGVIATLRDISPAHLAAYRTAHNLACILALAGFAALIVVGRHRLPLSFSIYAGIALLMTLVNPAILDGYYLPLRSMPRFCLVLFPCFITLALAGEHPFVDRLMLSLGPAGLAILAIVFQQGGWVA